MNVDHLRAEPPALRLMKDQTHPPAGRDSTILEGGATLGPFWDSCKRRKRCANSPCNRLLADPVLKADYRYSPGVTRDPRRTKGDWRVPLIGSRRMCITYGPSCPL